MIKKRYKCKDCGHEFILDVFESSEERNEWELQGRPSRLVCCKKCGLTNVVEI